MNSGLPLVLDGRYASHRELVSSRPDLPRYDSIANNVKELEIKLTKIVTDSNFRNRLAILGRQYAKCFSRNQIVDLYAQTFVGLLNKAKCGKFVC